MARVSLLFLQMEYPCREILVKCILRCGLLWVSGFVANLLMNEFCFLWVMVCPYTVKKEWGAPRSCEWQDHGARSSWRTCHLVPIPIHFCSLMNCLDIFHDCLNCLEWLLSRASLFELLGHIPLLFILTRFVFFTKVFFRY